MKHFTIFLFMVLVVPLNSYGESSERHAVHIKTAGVESLSIDLRDLLSEEMRALEQGMKSIIPAYISGNWGEISAIAGKMKNSYILKQSLTQSQMEELHTSLPHDFVVRDKHFHYLAGMLEHVAQKRKPELVNFYFSEMNEACLACHKTYAGHKFPAFSEEKVIEHSH